MYMPKVILITGASSGIGRACAEYLAEKGFVVYGTSRKAMMGRNGIRMLQMDVTSLESVKLAVDTIISEKGRIDVAINNAGMGVAGAAELTTINEIQWQIQTNFIGTVNVCNAVLPHMRKAGCGRIINISSLGGVMGIPFQSIYSASKFAVEGYSEALSLEVYPFNVKVIIVEPGDFSTEFTNNRIMSAATKNDPDYGARFQNCLSIIEREEVGGCHPSKIAKQMYRIVKSKRPRFRYKVGNLIQTNFARAKKIMPDRMYLRLLRFFYHV